MDFGDQQSGMVRRYSLVGGNQRSRQRDRWLRFTHSPIAVCPLTGTDIVEAGQLHGPSFQTLGTPWRS